MKEFRLVHGYRGRYFNIRFCARSRKHAAEILDTSVYSIDQWAGVNLIDEPYEGIKAMAYSHSAKVCIGHTNEMNFEDAKLIIDAECDRVMKQYRN